MIRTVHASFHRWRGLRRASDTFLTEIVIGWVTVGWSRFLLTDKLREFIAALRGRP